MSRRRSDDDTVDWKSVFMSYFSHDGAVGAQAADGEDLSGYFTTRATRAKAPVAVGSGPEDVPAASKGVADDLSPVDEDEQGEHVSPPVKNCSKLSPKKKKNDGQEAAVDLGPDVPAVCKGVDGLSLVDEDEQDEHVSHKNYLKLSAKPNEKKKKKTNNVQLPSNKRKGKGYGGKAKPTSVAKMHSIQPSSTALSLKKPAHDIDPEEESDSNYAEPLPNRFSKRRKQQVQNSSSVYSRKVKDVILLDDEDKEPKEEVNLEMSDRLNESKIYCPLRDDDEAIELARSDIKCLDPKAFLTSPVINFYIKYIKRTRLCNENSRDKFYIFNTYFFGKLKDAKYQLCDYAKLRRWWKGVNIFKNAYIILPIHAREHWSLIIICLPPKERISEPIILHLDSLEMHRSIKILSTIEWYLEKEWRYLSIAEPTWPCLLSDIRKEIVQVPQQDNAYDCGIFMLYYIERFIKEAPARFTTDKLGMFNRSWFKPEEASSLRQRIRELLVKGFENPRLGDARPEADESKDYDNIKDRELEADDSSVMIIEVGVGLGNTVESNGGMNVVALEEASGKSGVAIKTTTGGIKVASSQEASKESQYASNDIEGMKVATSEEASGESVDALKRTRGTNIATLQEASEEFRGAGKSIEGINVAELEEASEESGYAIKGTGGIKVAALQEPSEESQNVGKTIEGINVAKSEEASEKSGDAVNSTGGIKIAVSQEASEEFRNAYSESIEGINVAESKEASEESGDVVKSTEGIKVAASQEASEESQDTDKSIEMMEVAESEEESEESGYVKSTGGNEVIGSTPIPDVVFDSGVKRSEQNKEVIGSTSIPDVVCDDSSVKRYEENEEVIGSTPISDVGCGSSVNKLEGNEEATSSSMPVSDAVCEITGTKVWIKRVYRRTTLPPGNWSWSSGGSARDARRSFVEHFSRKYSKN